MTFLLLMILGAVLLFAALRVFGDHLETIDRQDREAGLRHDESIAPLAPRSYKVRNPTLRQIRENDLPRYIDKNGVVQTVEVD